jgi:hypothetical protein
VSLVGVNGYANFDLTALTVVAAGAAVSDTFIEDAGDGWRRIGFTAPSIVTGSAAGVIVATIQNDGDARLPVFLGTGRTFYRAMSQIEAGQVSTYSFASTFIPTVGANVTRSDDVMNYTSGIDFPRLNNSQGLSVTIGFYIDRVVASADRRVIAFTANNNNRLSFIPHSGDNPPICGVIYGDGTTIRFPSTGNAVAGQGYLGCVFKRKNPNPIVMSHISELRYAVANFGSDILATTIATPTECLFGPIRNIRIWASAQPEDVIRQWARNS